MKILLAADDSEYTAKAARFVAKHVKGFKSAPEIYVHHVVAPMPYAGAMKAVGKKAVEQYQREEADVALDLAARELGEAGKNATATYTVGDTCEEIKRFVEKHKIDLVVMGTRGHGALAGLALGSVAQKLLATLAAPILVVR
jgi:nucleotide-binding universal stress UspA family protein